MYFFAYDPVIAFHIVWLYGFFIFFLCKFFNFRREPRCFMVRYVYINLFDIQCFLFCFVYSIILSVNVIVPIFSFFVSLFSSPCLYCRHSEILCYIFLFFYCKHCSIFFFCSISFCSEPTFPDSSQTPNGLYFRSDIRVWSFLRIVVLYQSFLYGFVGASWFGFFRCCSTWDLDVNDVRSIMRWIFFIH